MLLTLFHSYLLCFLLLSYNKTNKPKIKNSIITFSYFHKSNFNICLKTGNVKKYKTLHN